MKEKNAGPHRKRSVSRSYLAISPDNQQFPGKRVASTAKIDAHYVVDQGTRSVTIFCSEMIVGVLPLFGGAVVPR